MSQILLFRLQPRSIKLQLTSEDSCEVMKYYQKSEGHNTPATNMLISNKDFFKKLSVSEERIPQAMITGFRIGHICLTHKHLFERSYHEICVKDMFIACIEIKYFRQHQVTWGINQQFN